MKYLIFNFISVCLVIFAINSPLFNWDMIGYVGSSISYQTDDQNSIHETTFTALKKHVPEGTYQVLTSGNAYREYMHTDAQLFSQQLPYYQIRVIYNSAIKLLSNVGLSPFFVTYLISSLSVLLGLFVISRLCFNTLTLHKSAVLFPLVIAYFGLYEVARLSTPDALAFLMSFIVFYLFINKRIYLCLCMLPLLILVRTDLFLLILSFALYFVFIDRTFLKAYLISSLCSVGVYIAINSYFGNYGWHHIFYVTLINQIPNPAEVDIFVRIQDYVQVLSKGFDNAFYDFAFTFYLTLCIFIFIYHLQYGKFWSIFRNSNQHLLEILHYINLIYYIGHFLLFPVVWSRFFVAQYGLTILLAIYLFLRNTSNQTKEI